MVRIAGVVLAPRDRGNRVVSDSVAYIIAFPAGGDCGGWRAGAGKRDYFSARPCFARTTQRITQAGSAFDEALTPKSHTILRNRFDRNT